MIDEYKSMIMNWILNDIALNLNDLDIYFSAITIYHNSHVFSFLRKIVSEKNTWFSALFLSPFLCPKKSLTEIIGRHRKNWLLLALLCCFYICFYWFKATENALMAYILLNLKTYMIIGNNTNKKTVALIMRFSLIT